MKPVRLNTISGCRSLANPDQRLPNLPNGSNQRPNLEGVAPFVGVLTNKIRQISEYKLEARSKLARTALTDLFASRYQVDIDELIHSHQNASFRLWGGMYKPEHGEGFHLSYQIANSWAPKTFWQLGANATYGYVNLHCVRNPDLPLVLRGEGNIALIPGTHEALEADIDTLLNINN